MCWSFKSHLCCSNSFVIALSHIVDILSIQVCWMLDREDSCQKTCCEGVESSAQCRSAPVFITRGHRWQVNIEAKATYACRDKAPPRGRNLPILTKSKYEYPYLVGTECLCSVSPGVSFLKSCKYFYFGLTQQGKPLIRGMEVLHMIRGAQFLPNFNAAWKSAISRVDTSFVLQAFFTI